ncbi:MAG TPA: glycosyltransferase family 4 protein [Burkholderiales bacterium]|nr:glycosyltransferase family 4 protein [Burkholderiales bacterium]
MRGLNPRIVMLGTSLDTRGGISSVVSVYEQYGLFERFGIRYIATHCDGSGVRKLRCALGAMAAYLPALVRRPALVHIHVASRASFWRKSPFFLLAFLFRVPAILHLHGAEFAIFYAKECGPLRKRFVSFVFDHCAKVIVLSGAWKAWAVGICANPNVVAIYNPVLTPGGSSPTARVPGTILFLGRLGHRKGSYDLLEAAARIVARRPDLRLLLGGDGQLEGIRARAAELGISDSVELLGWVRGEDKDRLLATAALYVLPSYNEGLPVSVLEAMAAGLPIVTTPVGGIPEAITDGVEGFLVAPGDINALTDRLERLLCDTQLARRMGEAARHRVDAAFSAGAVLPQIEALYMEMGLPGAAVPSLASQSTR